MSETKMTVKRNSGVKVFETIFSQDLFFFPFSHKTEREKLIFPLNLHSQKSSHHTSII